MRLGSFWNYFRNNHLLVRIKIADQTLLIESRIRSADDWEQVISKLHISWFFRTFFFKYFCKWWINISKTICYSNGVGLLIFLKRKGRRRQPNSLGKLKFVPRTGLIYILRQNSSEGKSFVEYSPADTVKSETTGLTSHTCTIVYYTSSPNAPTLGPGIWCLDYGT